MNIRLIGQANHTGIGTHYSGFVRALGQALSDVSIQLADPYDYASVDQAVAASRDQDWNICFTAHHIDSMRGRMIQWVPFETTKIPDYLSGALHNAHEVWTMTQWGAEVLQQNGFDRVCVMPQGVDVYDIDHTAPTNSVSVLMVAKYEQRKGIREALDAWSQSLINDPRYCLVIKSHGTNDNQGYQQLIDQIKQLGIENYRVYWGVMDEADVMALYRRSQIFLAPTYAEGWGRPIMEAAAMGLPIISTDWSAHGEWLATIGDSVRWVDYDLIPVSDPDYERAYGQQADWGVWARPRVESLARQIEYAADHLAQLTETARSNRRRIQDQYNWTQVVQKVLARLEKLNGKCLLT